MPFTHYDYAIQGEQCHTSMDTLTSNTKYLPVDSPIYNLIWTRTDKYGGPENKPIKFEKSIEKKLPQKGCCGR